MAFVSICNSCLDENHEECLKHWDTPKQIPGQFVCGGGICICKHGEPEGEWEKSVRESLK